MTDFIKLLRELREMGEKLPTWRFLLVCFIVLMATSSPFMFGLARVLEVMKQ